MHAPKDLDAFYLDPETLDVVLGRTAAIDIPRLNTPTFEAASAFIRNYGYDPDDPAQVAELCKLKDDALAFITRNLLQDPDNPSVKLTIPAEVLAEQQVRRLMLWATLQNDEIGHWSCSVLRVMHTLTHVSNDLAQNFFPAIQKQILDRVMSFVHTDQAGDVYLGGQDLGLRLYMVDVKDKKSQDSVVLKMLHKSDNVSSYIFDRIGFRFVTYNRVEAIIALQYLKQHLFAFPNVISLRSRNSLLDIPRYHDSLDHLKPRLGELNLSPTELARCVVDLGESKEMRPEILPHEKREHNVYSSTEYSSLQITCRQLVRVQGPPIAILPGRRQPEGPIQYKFYFPYELQVLDRASYVESRRGRASHAEYKRAQLRSVRERILPWLKGGSRTPPSSSR